MLRDLRPLLAQVDPALRQLNPILDFLGLYKRELTAFFANTVAATQATTVGSDGPVHYLRTQNPFNPENLAVYPKRLPSNRPNPYTLPGHFDKLRSGLPAYETRHCGREAMPSIVNTPQAIAPPDPLPDLTLPLPIPNPVPDVNNVVERRLQPAGRAVQRHPALRVPERPAERAARPAVHAAGTVHNPGRDVAVPAPQARTL